jgi:hypothetical protein
MFRWLRKIGPCGRIQNRIRRIPAGLEAAEGTLAMSESKNTMQSNSSAIQIAPHRDDQVRNDDNRSSCVPTEDDKNPSFRRTPLPRDPAWWVFVVLIGLAILCLCLAAWVWLEILWLAA